jgi:hypothetical protein
MSYFRERVSIHHRGVCRHPQKCAKEQFRRSIAGLAFNKGRPIARRGKWIFAISEKEKNN